MLSGCLLTRLSHEMALDALLRDLRYAIRALARTPLFSVTVVLTLALAIGANSAVFSALDAVLLRPLPFPDGDRLMELRQRVDATSESNIAPVRLEDWARLNDTFSAITGLIGDDPRGKLANASIRPLATNTTAQNLRSMVSSPRASARGRNDIATTLESHCS